ncbi:MAG TPA: potassium transporter [Candidatus Phocaeicola excrementigallinarum]|nr:potassium transporter [Candidatus Phocaeicola excrementigallinarum]
MDYWERLFLYRKKLLLPRINQLVNWTLGITYVCALAFLAAIVYEYGFSISGEERAAVHWVYRIVWVVFLLGATMQIVFRQEDSPFRFTPWTWVLSALLYLTLLPVIFNKPDPETEVYWVWAFFRSPYYRGTILLLYSFYQLSGSLVRLMGRRTNPPLILAGSFLVIILLGMGLLMLPRATYHGIHWIDALFTATSATCVTGLVSVDVPSTFTLEGQVIIILLIQVGGLGLMTLTSFFAMFFMGNTSIYNQLVVGDMISSNSLNSLLSTLLYILGFTLAIEGVGMAVIWYSIHGTLGMTLDEELFFSAFHSVSAFCNAGFSTLPGGMSNPMVMQGHNLLYVTLGLLIALGGIGFPILVNLYETVAYYLGYLRWKIFGRSRRFNKRVHLYNLNTKIVLVSTAFLLVLGTVVIAAVEWNQALAGMPVADKLVHSFFNSSCPRTAGFVSVPLLSFSVQTLLFMLVLMVIGGGTQSTAGGVKINVFAVVLLNLWAVVRGADHVTIMKRELSDDSIRRSNAVIMLYLIMVFCGMFLLSVLEPEASLLAVLFECVSALSTVGSSLDLTPTLGDWSKVLVVLMMFIGRVGAFTLATGLIRQEKKRKYRYPSDNIIIN